MITTCCWYFLYNRWITWDTSWSWLTWSRSWWSLARTVGSCSSVARLTRRPSMTSCWPSRASPFLMTQNLSITTPNCSRCVTCLWVIHCGLQTFMNTKQWLNTVGTYGVEWWMVIPNSVVIMHWWKSYTLYEILHEAQYFRKLLFFLTGKKSWAGNTRECGLGLLVCYNSVKVTIYVNRQYLLKISNLFFGCFV